MPVSKIKNVVILILLLTNLFLLMLLIPRLHLQRQDERAVREALEARFTAAGIRLGGDAVSETQTLYPLLLEPDRTQTLSAAAALLGTQPAEQSDPGNYVTAYRAESGSCLFYQSGSFTAELSGRAAVADISADARATLKAIGFSGAVSTLIETEEGGAQTVTATWEILGTPVPGTALSLSYRGGRLTGITGQYLSGQADVHRLSDTACLSCADALVAFLAARESLGWVGSSVNGTRQCYVQTESLEAGITLHPVWIIDTDTGSLRVDGLSGDVSVFEG